MTFIVVDVRVAVAAMFGVRHTSLSRVRQDLRNAHDSIHAVFVWDPLRWAEVSSPYLKELWIATISLRARRVNARFLRALGRGKLIF